MSRVALEGMDREDSAAVERCRGGSVEAFGPLVQRHAPRIIRLCYHFLGDWEEARDLAQETFARAFRSLDRYDAGRPFSAWLSTIAARLSTDRLRRRRAGRKALAGAPPREDFATASQEANLSLREALDHLTPRQRQSVVLCDLHGFTATEASAMIGCSASTVRVLRFLARRRLRAELISGEELSASSEEARAARTVGAADTPAASLALERGK